MGQCSQRGGSGSHTLKTRAADRFACLKASSAPAITAERSNATFVSGARGQGSRRNRV